MRKIISSDEAPQAIGPYSQAVEVSGVVYGSGAIPLDPKTGEVVPGGIQAQTHQVMKNVGAVLRTAGLDYKNLAKCSIFVKDMNDFATVNEIYAGYLDSAAYPARETVQVARLPKDVLVEISFIAVRD